MKLNCFLHLVAAGLVARRGETDMTWQVEGPTRTKHQMGSLDRRDKND